MRKNMFMEVVGELKDLCDSEHKDDCPPFSFRAYWGTDGTPVIEVSIPEENKRGPVCRIWLGEATIWENPPVPEDNDEQ